MSRLMEVTTTTPDALAPLLVALIGLLGALIGAGAAIGAQILSQRSSQKSARRKESADLVANHWTAGDRLWRATRTLNETIFQLITSRKRSDSILRSRQEGFPDLFGPDNQRLTDMAEKRLAENEAAFMTAQMRFLCPSLAPAAEALRSASTRHRAEDSAKHTVDRQSALDAFEAAAPNTLN